MQIEGKRVMILGGWGLVGSAICRELVGMRPSSITLTSLLEWQAKDAVRQLELEFPECVTKFSCEWGNIFGRADSKDLSRKHVLDDDALRQGLLGDIFDPLDEEILHDSFLYQILEKHRPEIIVDCVNSATAFAYQDIYTSTRNLRNEMAAWTDKTPVDHIRKVVESHAVTAYVPQLIRHVQLLYGSMMVTGTRIYLKIGTSGTGGMGLNIPYTHSEEHPSRVLLSKSAVAGAHSLLLFLMARTPGGPIIKEIKPAALIAWKGIGHGPISKQGVPIKLFDCEESQAVDLSGELASKPAEGLASHFNKQGTATLEGVYIDTGENGIFTTSEFEAVTMVGQMEFVTPEEIARHAIYEIQGNNTGTDIITALDQTCMGPTYRAGAMRDAALRKMRNLEQTKQSQVVAFEMLGPPKLSKFLYEAYILRRIGAGIERIGEFSPEIMSQKCHDLIKSDARLRSQILSIGIPILLPDGRRLLRGPDMKIPVMHGAHALPITPENLDQWARDGWVDLRVSNMEVWKGRLEKIVHEIESIPFNDSSSRYDRNAEFWFGQGEFNVGRIAGWIFMEEQKGSRMK